MKVPSNVKDRLAYWIHERENIRLKKEVRQQPAPWSVDPVFRSVYFTNVDREKDRVTKALRAMYPEDFPVEYAAVSYVLARLVNKPESLQALGWPKTDGPGENFVTCMSQPGAWGGAYLVSTNGRPIPKPAYVLLLLEQAYSRLVGPPATVLGATLQSAHRAIQGVQGMGSFMAAQVVADLKNTPHHPLQQAEDWHTFAAHGPGSLRGLSRFHEKKVLPSNFTEHLVSARQYLQAVYPGVLALVGCNQNLQSCFCEFDKYERVRNKEGRSKRVYRG